MTLQCNKTQPHQLRITSRLTGVYSGTGTLHQGAVQSSSHTTAASLNTTKAAACITW